METSQHVVFVDCSKIVSEEQASKESVVPNNGKVQAYINTEYVHGSTSVLSVQQLPETIVSAKPHEEIITQKNSSTDRCSDGNVIKVAENNEGSDDSTFKTSNPMIGPIVSEDGMFFCRCCDYKTDKKQNWYKHKQTHSGVKRHQCTECNYATGSVSNMKRHMLKHQNIKNFVCGLCSADFRQKVHLERHIQKAHLDPSFTCSECDQQCKTEKQLARHVQRHHQNFAMVTEGSDIFLVNKSFLCPFCKFTSEKRAVVQQHMKFHRKGGSELKMFCRDCSFVTDCASRLDRHRRTHTKEKPFVCKLCGYKATQREHIARHLKVRHHVIVPRVHSNHRKKPIATCRPLEVISASKETNVDVAQLMPDASVDGTRETRTNDNQTTSGVDQNWKISLGDDSCDTKQLMCGESTQKPEPSLVRNELVVGQPAAFGTGSKPFTDNKLFACNFCSLTFSKLLSLYRHVHLQHKDKTEHMDNLNCVICNFSARTYNTLLAHMRKHTASEEAKMAGQFVLDDNDPEKNKSLFTFLQASGGSLVANTHNSGENSSNTKTLKVEIEGKAEPVLIDLNVDLLQRSRDTINFCAGEINHLDDVNNSMESALLQESENDKISYITVSDASEVIGEMKYVNLPQSTSTSSIRHSSHTITSNNHEVQATESPLDIFPVQNTITEFQNNEYFVAEKSDDIDVKLFNVADQLVSGDFIEINGETYKVEVSNIIEQNNTSEEVSQIT